MVDEYLLWLVGPPVAAITVLAILFLAKFRLGQVAVGPSEALQRLAYALRLSRYMVTELPNRITVRVNSWTMVEVFAEPWEAGTRLAFRAGATTGAWVFIIIFLVGLTGSAVALVSISVVAAIFLNAWWFARRRILPLLANLSAPPPGTEADRARAALVTGLSEAHRFAQEAYETERSAYQDAHGLVALTAIVAWAVAFSLAFFANEGAEFGPRVWDATKVSLLAGLAVEVPFAVTVYRHWRARLREFRDWADRLRSQLEAETVPGRTPEAEPSAFETLAQASREVPRWVGVRRDRFFQRDPGAAIILFIVAFWALFTLSTGAYLIMTLPFLGLGLLLAGVGLAAAAVYAFRRWRGALHRDAERELAAWQRRLDGLRDRMDRFLEEL